MNCNKIFTTTLTYCGKEFYTHVYKKDDVFNGYATVPLILEQCKNGERLNISWKYYRETNKKIIVNVAKAIA